MLANEEGALIVSYHLSEDLSGSKEESAPAFRIRFDLGSHHLIFSDRIGLRITNPPKEMQHKELCSGFKSATGDKPCQHRSGSWWKQRCDSRSPIHTSLLMYGEWQDR